MRHLSGIFRGKWFIRIWAVSFLAVILVGSALGAEPEYRRLPLGRVTADGWLRDQLLRSKAGTGGNLDLLEPEMIAKPYVTRDHKSKVSPGWSGEISGTYWTGLVQLAFTLNDPELIAKADSWVHACLALQEEDGYLGSYRPTDNRLEDYCAWSANWCYRVLLSWYDATGEQEVLDAVHRGLLWFVENWKGDQKTNYAGPTLMEAMVDVYLLTGDQRLGDWCSDYLNWLDGHDSFRQGRKSLERPELEYNEDHTVAFAENVKHPALVSLVTGDPALVAASENGVKQVLDKSWQCTGGPVSNFEYQGPPGSNHETEYCSFATWENTFSRMLCITGNPRYGDLMEWTLFNGAQGARKNDERAIAYNSSPNQVFATMDSSLFGCDKTFEVYAPCIHVACCPAQAVRIYPEYVRALFLRDREGNLTLPVFGPATARFQDGDIEVTVTEKTLYPFNGTVELKISCSQEWNKTIRLKRPQWCHSVGVQRDGNSVSVTGDDWLVLPGPWKDNEITVTFAMEPEVCEIPDEQFQVEPLRIVRCGPLLYAAEYEAVWTPIPGNPITPLPEGWSWFNVTCKEKPVFYSLKKSELSHLAIQKEQKEAGGNVWDDPPTRLVVPMIRSSRYGWPRLEAFDIWDHTRIPYGNPVIPDDGAGLEPVVLVPFGCTTLRQACFTVIRE